MEIHNWIVGMTVGEATFLLHAIDMKLRVINRDGKWLIVTDDMWPNRLNVTVEKDIITEVNHAG